MNKNVERISLAFLLSFVGSIIAQQLGALWWIGLIVGFASGYIGYDVREFIRAIPMSFRRASTRPASSITAKEWIANFCRCTFYTVGAGISAVLTTVPATFILLTGHFPILDAELLFFTSCISIAFTLFFIGITWSSASDPKYRASHIEIMSEAVLWMHPIPFVVRTLPIWTFYALLAVAWVTEKGCEFACRFIRHLFRLVHSHERVLFGIDVAIGVAVGHYTGNAILGGLAGMAWWIFDHHLISVKWLKIEPAR